MNKLVPILFIGVLVLSGLGAVAHNSDVEEYVSETEDINVELFELSNYCRDVANESIKKSNEFRFIIHRPYLEKVAKIFSEIAETCKSCKGTSLENIKQAKFFYSEIEAILNENK